MPSANFRFTDPRQERIHRRLRLIGPGPAAFFKDACALMAGNGSLETTPHLVAHLLREVESGLRDVLVPYGFERPAPCPHCQSRPGSHRQEVRAILSAYGIDDTDLAAEAWLRLSGWDQETGLARLAHRRALGPPRPADEGVRKAWDEMQGLLDAVLEIFETRFLESFKVLDELLAKESPESADAKRLRKNIPNNLVTFGYFFDKLENPKWLTLLDKEGFFALPPQLERDDETGSVSISMWPASRYLARMAKRETVQANVLEIALKIPDTENVRVYEDLADTALALPSTLAARLVSKVGRGLTSPHQILLPEKLGALVAQLSEGGEKQAALDLGAELLAVLPDDRPAIKETAGEEAILSREGRGRFDPWWYQQILKKHVPALVRVAGLDAVRLLSRLLTDALQFSARRGEEAKPDDYSAIWRPAIEVSERSSRGVKDALVSAVRDAAEAVVGADPSRISEVVRTIEEHGWHVFQRIALDLLFRYPAEGELLIGERLTSRVLFEESGRSQLRREYRRLVREHFGKLKADQQAIILGWIDEGPDREILKRRFGEWEGRQATEEDIDRLVKQWQLDQMAPIAAALSDGWKERYEGLVRELGAPSDSDSAVEISSGSYGPTSPLSAEELKAEPVEEIIEYLKTWIPPTGFMAPSREGVGRALTEAVAADPTRFSALVGPFRELHPTYVRSLLEGFTRARKENKTLSWMEVLELCLWVVEQPREWAGERADRVDPFEDDPDWGWTRKTIVRLLSGGFGTAEGGIPADLRPQVWAVLRPLTDDPDPTPEHEARYGGSNMDPPTLAINTVRGDAIHAVMEYAIWVWRHHESNPDTVEKTKRGFEEMPEIREVLERHLDPKVDPSAAVRSGYGRHLPWLILLDRTWVSQNLTKIFPDDPAFAHLRDAAWETYIVFCAPYNDPLLVLHHEYEKAIERIGIKVDFPSGPGNPDEHLADHLMVFYWRGKLELDDPTGLLAHFYARANARLRREAFEFIGRSLKDTVGDVEEGLKQRLVHLWQRRFEVARDSGNYEELETFGWWFGSTKLDSTWTLDQLVAILRVTTRIDPDFLVLEELTKLAPVRPREVVECFRHMVEGMREAWELQVWREEMEKSLRIVLASNDMDAKKDAVDFVNILVAKGQVSFRDLLS